MADGQEKRRTIGERIIKAIRFPVMKLEEFASVVLDCKILTSDEVTDIIKSISSVQSSSVIFPVTKRSTPLSNLILRCCRFDSMKSGWSNGFSRLTFSVDHDILFRGVYLFGSKDKMYSVKLTLKVASDATKMVHVSSLAEGKFSSLLHKSVEFYGFDVLFAEPIPLKKGKECYLGADISGLKSWYGTSGKRTVQCSHVTFTFKKSSSLSGTNSHQGQFCEFIFSLSEN